MQIVEGRDAEPWARGKSRCAGGDPPEGTTRTRETTTTTTSTTACDPSALLLDSKLQTRFCTMLPPPTWFSFFPIIESAHTATTTIVRARPKVSARVHTRYTRPALKDVSLLVKQNGVFLPLPYISYFFNERFGDSMKIFSLFYALVLLCVHKIDGVFFSPTGELGKWDLKNMTCFAAGAVLTNSVFWSATFSRSLSLPLSLSAGRGAWTLKLRLILMMEKRLMTEMS